MRSPRSFASLSVLKRQEVGLQLPCRGADRGGGGGSSAGGRGGTAARGPACQRSAGPQAVKSWAIWTSLAAGRRRRADAELDAAVLGTLLVLGRQRDAGRLQRPDAGRLQLAGVDRVALGGGVI